MVGRGGSTGAAGALRDVLGVSSVVLVLACDSDGSPQTCRSNSDCRDGYRCAMVVSERRCVAIQTTKPLGGPCKEDGDCAAGLFCRSDWPGGMCVRECTADQTCDSVSTCAKDLDSICVPACGGDSECRTEYICAPLFGSRACLPRNEVLK